MSQPADTVALHNGDALVIVDVQRGFVPGDALAVPDGDAVVMPKPSSRKYGPWGAVNVSLDRAA